MTKLETKPRDITRRNTYLWVIFVSLGGLIYIPSFWFPDVVLTCNQPMSACPEKVFEHIGYNCTDFYNRSNHIMAFEIDSFTSENILLQLKAMVVMKDTYRPRARPLKKLKPRLDIEENYFIVDENQNILKIIRERNLNSQLFRCMLEDGVPVCPILTMTELLPKNIPGKLMLVTRLEKAFELSDKHFRQVKIAFQTFNPKFLKYMSSFKWTLFLIAAVCYYFYRNGISHLSKHLLSPQQSLVSFAGITLLLFNEPLLSYTNALFMEADTISLIKTCISIAVMQLQCCVLIYFWLNLIHNIASSQKDDISCFPKFIMRIFIVIHFCASCFAYYIFNLQQSDSGTLDELYSDPASTLNHVTKTCEKYFHGATAFIIIWSLIKLFKVSRQIKNLEWRESLAFTFSFCFIACYLYFIGTGSLRNMSLQGPRIALLYGITTLYTVLLQLIYLPFESEIEEAKDRHKHPSSPVKVQYKNLGFESEGPETPGLGTTGYVTEMGSISKRNENDDESQG